VPVDTQWVVVQPGHELPAPAIQQFHFVGDRYYYCKWIFGHFYLIVPLELSSSPASNGISSFVQF